MNFKLSDNQVKEYNQFCSEQYKKNNDYEGAIGGRFSITFTMTSIGQIITVTDNITKEKKDITEYEGF